MKKAIIVAISHHRVIGSNNTLPWHMPADMRYFRKTTHGHPIIMGRKTFTSIGKALPGRMNIVISRQAHLSLPPACHLDTSLEQAFQQAEATGAPEAFVIGGGQVYAQALPLVDTLYITEVHTEVQGETYFPAFDKQAWKQVYREHHNADRDNPYPYTFVKYISLKP